MNIKNFLFVENDMYWMQEVTNNFASKDIKVQHVNNMIEAMQIISTGSNLYHCVVINVSCVSQNSDIAALVENIKSSAPFIKIIFTLDNNDPYKIVAISQSEANGYLIKPYTLDALLMEMNKNGCTIKPNLNSVKKNNNLDDIKVDGLSDLGMPNSNIGRSSDTMDNMNNYGGQGNGQNMGYNQGMNMGGNPNMNMGGMNPNMGGPQGNPNMNNGMHGNPNMPNMQQVNMPNGGMGGNPHMQGNPHMGGPQGNPNMHMGGNPHMQGDSNMNRPPNMGGQPNHQGNGFMGGPQGNPNMNNGMYGNMNGNPNMNNGMYGNMNGNPNMQGMGNPQGHIPNGGMNMNGNRNPHMQQGNIPNGGMNPNMGGMNPHMGGMNPNMNMGGNPNMNMGGMNPNMGRGPQGGPQGRPGVVRIPKNTTIAVHCPKGGVGKSSVSKELAITYAMSQVNGERLKVCLVDMDIDYGDIAVMLELKQSKSISDWARNIRQRMSQFGENEVHYSYDEADKFYLLTHKSGLKVLAAPTNHRDAAAINEEMVKIIIENLKTMFDVVIIDTGNNVKDFTVTSMELSDRILMVGNTDVSTINELLTLNKTLEQIQFPTNKIALLMNEVKKGEETQAQEIATYLGLPIIGKLPKISAIEQANNNGDAISMSSHDNMFTVELKRVANTILPVVKRPNMQGGPQGGPNGGKNSKGGGFFGLFKRKK